MSLVSLPDCFQTFATKRILVVGDIMLDRFIYGGVSRISPEAPVPVVHVESESFFPGGAANVARNLTPFAKSVDVCGVRGTDGNGAQLDASLRDGGVGTSAVLLDPSYATVSKTRVIARHQQVVRIDREAPTVLSADQRSEILESIRSLIGNLDAIIFEDYAKGFFDEAMVGDLIALAREAGVVTTVDPNPRNPLPWRGVTAVKPNRVEAFEVVGIPDTGIGQPPLEDTNLLAVGADLLKRWETGVVLITLGEQGMILFEEGKDPFHIPTEAREVYDVSGAGDTAIALFTLGLAAGLPPQDCAALSNRASGAVVGKLGTAAVAEEDFTEPNG